MSLCNGTAVCVSTGPAHNKVGVIALSSGKAFCATCRYGRTSCEHVEALAQVAYNDIEKDSILYQFLHAFQMQPGEKKDTPPIPIMTCLSKAVIPFIPSIEQQHIMKQPSSIRFGIRGEDGRSILVPCIPEVCSECGCQNTLTTLTFVRHAHVITPTEIVPTNGNIAVYS